MLEMNQICEMKSSVIHLSAEEKFCCLSCGNSSAEWVFRKVKDYFLPTGIQVDYARCSSCELVQQHPIPTDVRPFYDEYPVHDPRKSQLHESMRRIVFRNLYFNARSLPENAVILDYGCGDGWFLDSLSALPVRRMGFEYDPAHAQKLEARLGLSVYHDLDQLDRDWAGKIDQITMHFVVEHLTDVEGTFGRLTRFLKPGGGIYAVFPNIESREFLMFGQRWHGFDAPRHISFPNMDHVNNMISQHGLTVSRHGWVSFPNTMAASLSIAFTGRYRYPVFLLMLPLGLVWSSLCPDGTYAVHLTKQAV